MFKEGFQIRMKGKREEVTYCLDTQVERQNTKGHEFPLINSKKEGRKGGREREGTLNFMLKSLRLDL